MATNLSIPGIGSGLDVNSLVGQLVAVERRPIDLLTKQTSTLQAKLSAFGLLQSYTVNIHDSVARLAEASFWQKTAASSTDSGSVSVAASTSAANGSYSVEVQQLAQAQSLSSRSYADAGASVGTGTLRIEIGSWNADKTAFTASTPPSAIDVPVPLGEDTLESVRAKINAGNAGVSASIVKDANGSRLVIRSTATGVERSVRITATADAPAVAGAPSLNDLAYDPAHGAAGLTQTTAAQNAKAKINGVDIESASNTLSDVSDGLSLTISKVTTAGASVQVTVGLDTAAMKSAVGDFVKAYNDINRYLADQTKFDPQSKVGATLQGDRSTLSLQSQLRNAVQGTSGASASLRRLSDVGLEVQPDGSLKINDAKLAGAMQNMGELSKAFSASGDGNAANAGFAVKLKALTSALTDADGLVATRSKGLRDNIARNGKQVDVYDMRSQAYEARLLKQYSALDVKLNNLTNLNNYVAQQITTWNKSA